MEDNHANKTVGDAPAAPAKRKLGRKHKLAIAWFAVLAGAFGLTIAANVLLAGRGVVYSDQASVGAPTAAVVANGKLTEVDVKVGDMVAKDQVVGAVDGVPVKTKQAGLVVAVSDKIGEAVTAANPVATVADLDSTWVEVKVDEDKVAPIQVGQAAWFVADAYPGDRIQAIVSEITPVTSDDGLAFTISDKRATKQFTVKLRYDVGRFSKLRPGMSAKAWIRT